MEVIDSAQGSLGLALVVIAAARAQCFTPFETLGYLRKDGRIGEAQALLRSFLKIKPMVIIKDGEAHPLGRARTSPRPRP